MKRHRQKEAIESRIETGTIFTVTRGPLLTALQWVFRAVEKKDPIRPPIYFKTIHIRNNAGIKQAVSTDGHRMHVFTSPKLEIEPGTYRVIVATHVMIAQKTELEFPDYPKIMEGKRETIFEKREYLFPKILFEINRAGNCVNPDYIRDACQKDVGLRAYKIGQTILLESDTYYSGSELYQALIMPMVI